MVDVLAFGAHPDDIEFGCGGILARLASEGRTLVIVDLTTGQKGTQGTPEGRRQEGLEAAKVLGAERVYLDFVDCEVFDSYEGRLKLTRVIRHYRPTLVLAPPWKGEQTHPDHTACGLMARHACRYARLAKVMEDVPPHRVGGILHYGSFFGEPIDFLVDVTAHVEQWKAMMACHRSQMKTHDYADWVLRNAARLGALLDTTYAQGLVKGNPIRVDDVMSISRGSREL